MKNKKLNDFVKMYKKVSREEFKDFRKRNSIIKSKKFRKPKYKINYQDEIEEFFENKEGVDI